MEPSSILQNDNSTICSPYFVHCVKSNIRLYYYYNYYYMIYKYIYQTILADCLPSLNCSYFLFLIFILPSRWRCFMLADTKKTISVRFAIRQLTPAESPTKKKKKKQTKTKKNIPIARLTDHHPPNIIDVNAGPTTLCETDRKRNIKKKKSIKKMICNRISRRRRCLRTCREWGQWLVECQECRHRLYPEDSRTRVWRVSSSERSGCATPMMIC